MTIYRSNLLLGIAAFSVFAVSASAQAPTTAWTMSYSDSEGLQKLMFVPKGSNHGEVYLRCRPGDGWIFLIHDVDVGSRKSMTVSSGAAVLFPSVSREYDEVDEVHYFDAAIASNDAVMGNFAGGQKLTVDDVSYPVRTAAEASSVRNFVRICGTGQ